MSTDEVSLAATMRQPCDEWLDLMTAADGAGRWAARQLVCQCSAWHLGRGGSVSVHIEPADSPLVAWLYRHGYAAATSAGLLMPVTVTAEALRPATGAAKKSRSLLVRHAYATAFCTVLAEEAGAAAEVQLAVEHTVPHRDQCPHRHNDARGQRGPQAPTSPEIPFTTSEGRPETPQSPAFGQRRSPCLPQPTLGTRFLTHRCRIHDIVPEPDAGRICAEPGTTAGRIYPGRTLTISNDVHLSTIGNEIAAFSSRWSSVGQIQAGTSRADAT